MVNYPNYKTVKLLVDHENVEQLHEWLPRLKDDIDRMQPAIDEYEAHAPELTRECIADHVKVKRLYRVGLKLLRKHGFDGALLTCTGFLKVRTDSEGRRLWSCISHNRNVCTDTSLSEALAVANRVFGRVALAVWDCDKGEFDSEMLADATY